MQREDLTDTRYMAQEQLVGVGAKGRSGYIVRLHVGSTVQLRASRRHCTRCSPQTVWVHTAPDYIYTCKVTYSFYASVRL